MDKWKKSVIILDDRLSCTPNITAVAQSCRNFPLHNPQDLVFPHKGHIATLGPSAGQNALVSHVTPRRPPLASCCSSLPVQEHGAGLQGCQRTELHPSTSKHWSDHTLQREHFPLLHQLGWLVPPSLRTNKVHSVKSRLFSVLAPQLVERTPNQCQNSRITHHLRQKIQDSLAQTSPWPRIA